MQILDDDGHPDGQRGITSAGSNYALHAPADYPERAVGEWNQLRLVVEGARVEQWLNGAKVVEYELWTEEWEALVAASKFAQWPEYGRGKSGLLALQDHGNDVWFREIRIKPLD